MQFYDILSVVILNLYRDRLVFVLAVFLQVAWICCHDRLFLCRDNVVLSCIAETELYVTIDSFHVATESSLLFVAC